MKEYKGFLTTNDVSVDFLLLKPVVTSLKYKVMGKAHKVNFSSK